MNRRLFLGNLLGLGALAACSGIAPTPAVADDDEPDDPAGAACATATADNIEGPFFVPGAPRRAVLATARDRGQPLALSGRVLATTCAALGGATIQVWHADAGGAYDLDGFRFRGTLRTDADGRWSVRTIVPGRYLNGRRYRPAHVHVKVAAPGFRPLTTQLYFEGDPYNDGDPFVVRSLIMPHATRAGVTRASFDLVLASQARRA